MKTMGLSELVLVAPKIFPSEEATARASGADDVLADASIAASLGEAIADCSFVVGASARLRAVTVPTFDPRACAREIWDRLGTERVALVMGPEQSGLSNEDLALCQRLVHIPSDPDYASLNLAAALQVLCYELHMEGRCRADIPALDEPRHPPATSAEMEYFFEHLEQVLVAAEFLTAAHPVKLRLKLRRLFQRAAPDQNEINILRGMLSALDPRRRSVGDRDRARGESS